MTLDTKIYVHDPVDVRETFDHCRSLIGATDEYVWDDDPGRCISMKPGQGLPAWLMLHYGNDEPYRSDQESAAHEDFCDDDCDGAWHRPACWFEISFDTGYSYSDEHGGCGDLHARIVADLGVWLDGRSVSWSWNNEFTGDVHGGDDRYERLVDLCSGGRNAQEWFLTTALPAILHARVES